MTRHKTEMFVLLISLGGECSVTEVDQDMRGLSVIRGVVIITSDICVKSVGVEVLMFSEI